MARQTFFIRKANVFCTFRGNSQIHAFIWEISLGSSKSFKNKKKLLKVLKEALKEALKVALKEALQEALEEALE